VTVEGRELPKLLSPAQVAKAIGCTPSHVRHLCREGVLVAANIGLSDKSPRYAIPESELLAFLSVRGLSSAASTVTATGAHTEAHARASAVSGSKR
jgi:hypothetical protein